MTDSDRIERPRMTRQDWEKAKADNADNEWKWLPLKLVNMVDNLWAYRERTREMGHANPDGIKYEEADDIAKELGLE